MLVSTVKKYGYDNGLVNFLYVRGYTSCTIELDGRRKTFRAASSLYNSGEWYDWCLFTINDDDLSKVQYSRIIIGFIKY